MLISNIYLLGREGESEQNRNGRCFFLKTLINIIMKKIVLFAAGALCAFGASAQSYLLNNPDNHSYLGIRASYNMSLPGKVKADAGGTKSDIKLLGKGSGFSIGAVYNMPVVANMYFEPGLTLSYTTESFKLGYGDFPEYLNKAMKHSSLRKFGMEVPVQVGYHFDFTPDVSLQVSTGPVLKVGFVNDYYFTTEDLPVLGVQHSSGSMYGDNGMMRRVDCAWRVGVGFNINKSYYIGVNGDLGMCNMLKTDNDGTVSLHENAFNVTLGYNF